MFGKNVGAIGFSLLSALCVAFSCCGGERTAEADLRKQLAAREIRIGYDKAKSRFAEIGVAEREIPSPSDFPNFERTRSELAAIAILDAKKELLRRISMRAEGVDTVALASDGDRSVQTLKSVMRLFSSMELVGCRVISMAESWDAASKTFQVAAAVGWSRKSAGQAAAALNEANIREAVSDEDDPEWEKWFAGQNVSVMAGGRQFADGDGRLRFVGIAAVDVQDASGAMLRVAMRKAGLYALQSLSFSLYSDASAKEVAIRYLKEIEVAGASCSLSWSSFVSEVMNRCKNKIVKAHEVYSTTVTSPFTGKKVYVSAYGMVLK